MKPASEQSEIPPPQDMQPILPKGSLSEIEPKKKQSWLGILASGLVFLILIAVAIFLVWQHDLVSDWFVLRGYVPPPTVEELASADTMNAYATRLFYVNKPQLADKTLFNKHCSATDQVSVLGCYTGNRRGIYLYNVTDSRLAGIQQVTAAHEVLHQAYDRLSHSERDHINQLLEAYAKTITDTSLQAKLATYEKIEPHDVVNEMHSIFGTEVANLPPELEQYYARYFTDRKKVIQFHDKYQAAFTEHQQQLKDYDVRIDVMKQKIEADKTEIEAQELVLQTDRDQLDSYTESGRIAEYNASVPPFNAKVIAYKNLVAETNKLIDQYNDLIGARNTIAIQEQQLEQALDSHAAAAPKQ
ncbi:MAG TPA: hypothetical protein VLH38_03790 [Patescibacteria group bacterium]|nr:hypothetical protein [Patescibacteria group bacterium]